MHFEAVLILIGRSAHAFERAALGQIVIHSLIYAERTERRIVGGERGQGAGVEIDVVAGPQHNDALVVAQRSRRVCVRCCATAER